MCQTLQTTSFRNVAILQVAEHHDHDSRGGTQRPASTPSKIKTK